MIGQMSFSDVLEPEKTRIEQIEYEDARYFIMNIHYARRMPCIQYAFGLFVGGWR